MDTKQWDRRSVLLLGAASGLATGLLGAGAWSASARSPYFDLGAEALPLYTGASLSSETIQQSFAFEPDHGGLFVAQLLAGSPGKAGDLRITEMDRRGRIRGWMTLLGYGHAVSFGVHRGRRGLDLWIEGRVNDNGYGTVLKQVPWQHGATMDQDDPRTTDHQPVPDAQEYTCAIDHRWGRMAVSYWSGVDKRVAILPLREVLRGRVPDPVADFARPAGLGTFQGYALDGDSMYTIDGNSYSDTNPVPGNTHLGRIDWRTGELVERVHNVTGAELDFREPEGLAIEYRQGRPRLYLGFASGVIGDRRSNIYYLERC
ncbi:teichoic acid biosynthesis protein C [Occultella aeris]|uniref:Teichoic acid biosynthesis protein C n=1 Tax=Occultella aeris TaxID=2761496 RepID=A0A7M4DQ77_9MICO|nr:teichoic acid biosynthesis protein C [Occultella aeris]VZO39621.1 hypothetical protein HALOF300_04315 [Occultella aeris]